jgi:hypothetical protein
MAMGIIHRLPGEDILDFDTHAVLLPTEPDMSLDSGLVSRLFKRYRGTRENFYDCYSNVGGPPSRLYRGKGVRRIDVAPLQAVLLFPIRE